jgi:hypothetical protein
VVPSAPQEPSLPQVPDADAVDTLANATACLAELTHALTTHLGPMARVLVKRHADKIANPSALIAVLVKEIPTAEERLEFMARARQVFQRQLG